MDIAAAAAAAGGLSHAHTEVAGGASQRVQQLLSGDVGVVLVCRGWGLVHCAAAVVRRWGECGVHQCVCICKLAADGW